MKFSIKYFSIFLLASATLAYNDPYEEEKENELYFGRNAFQASPNEIRGRMALVKQLATQRQNEREQAEDWVIDNEPQQWHTMLDEDEDDEMPPPVDQLGKSLASRLHDWLENKEVPRQYQKVAPFHGNHLNRTNATMGSARVAFTLEELWHSWMSVNGKTYSSHAEEAKRFDHFVETYDKVQKHNERFRNGLEHFDVAVNHFADLPSREFRQKVNGFTAQRRIEGLTSIKRTHYESRLSRKLPDHVDWRGKAVTSVKNQGMCGCCWAFSTTGALEGQFSLLANRTVSMSEQNLIDCSVSYGNNGCKGGIMDEAFQYVRDNGIDTERSYPFQAKDENCRFRTGHSELDFSLERYFDIPSGDEYSLAEAVAFHGPVSVAIDASHESLQYYTEGVYSEPKCGNAPEHLDHGVLVVGYGTDSGTNIPYWLVKNSWSTRWGENGYLRIARNRKNMCGIATMASFPQLRLNK